MYAFGFEPNPEWSSRLKEIDAAYNAVDFQTVMFMETAISNKTGNLTFFTIPLPKQNIMNGEAFHYAIK